MIIEINWMDFHSHFLKTSEMVFVKEDDMSWKFYTVTGAMVVKVVVYKPEQAEQRMAFVDRYMNNPNIIKAINANEELSVNFAITKNDL